MGDVGRGELWWQRARAGARARTRGQEAKARGRGAAVRLAFSGAVRCGARVMRRVVVCSGQEPWTMRRAHRRNEVMKRWWCFVLHCTVRYTRAW